MNKTILKKQDMNTKHLIILVIIGFCVVSCRNHPTQVKVNNQEVTMAPFENIDAGGEFTIIYTQGDGYSVRVEGDEKQVKALIINAENNTLSIYPNDKLNDKSFIKNAITNLKDVKIHVKSPTLKELELCGSGAFLIPNPLKVSNLHVDKTGSGNLLIAGITCQDLFLDILGSGNVEIAGINASSIETDKSGSGNLILAGTAVKHHEEIMGSGKVDLSGLH